MRNKCYFYTNYFHCLMDTLYKNNEKYLVAVDCIIFGFHKGELTLLLIKRDFNPCLGEWSLMGGFLNQSESINQAAERVLFDLTGLDSIYLDQIGVFGDIKRDPADRVLSVAYYALINRDDFESHLLAKHNATWFSINKMPPLIFDHEDMVKEALRQLRRKASVEPIGFNLLPEKFTLPHLQALYEAIYGHELDKRNFRKKVQSIHFLEKSEEKDKNSSRRGAYLYTFNMASYERLKEEGFTFAL